MKISKQNIQSVFIWIGVFYFTYVLLIADAKPRQALKEIETGNAPQSVKNQVSDCEQILNDIDRVGLVNYLTNGKRDAPAAPQQNNQQQQNPNPNYYNNNYYHQAYQAPAAPQKKRTNWNPFKNKNR